MNFSKKNHEQLKKNIGNVSKTTMKIILFGLMALAISITSCEKEGLQGPAGPAGQMGQQGIQGTEGPAGQDGEAQGVPGPTGPAGSDGTNGTDGADGNANVRTFIYDLTSFSGDEYSKIISEFTQEVLENDVVLSYIKKSISYYPIPTTNLNLGQAGGDVDVQVKLNNGSFTMEFFNSDSNISQPLNSGTLQSLKVVIIKSTGTTSGKQTTKENIQNQLKNAGVDINDYYSVMDYFGLEY